MAFFSTLLILLGHKLTVKPVARALLPAGSRLVSTLFLYIQRTPARVPAQQTKSLRHECFDAVYDPVVLTRELALRALDVRSQFSTPSSKERTVGESRADLVVDNQLVVELKSVDRFSNQHVAQCIDYLRASRLRFALLIDFQHPKVHSKRIVFG